MASVSVDQLSALIDFLESNRELALGYCNRSKEGRSQAKRLWEQGSTVLNSVSSNCVQKTPEQWRLYYNEYKSKLLKKIKVEKAEKIATGGGPSRPIKLTPLQERLYDILGRDIGDPLPGVRHNPLSASQSQNSLVLEEEVVDIYVPQDQNSQILEELVIPLAQNNEVLDVNPEQLEPNLQLSEPSTSQEEPNRLPGLSTPNSFVFPAPPAPRLTAPTPAPPTPRQTAPPTQRRRRRRVHRSPQLANSSADQDHMREASERLEAMERLSAEATREHAQATHRLAAALEAVAERLREPIVFVIQNPPRSRRRRPMLYSSESDDSNTE